MTGIRKGVLAAATGLRFTADSGTTAALAR